MNKEQTEKFLDNFHSRTITGISKTIWLEDMETGIYCNFYVTSMCRDDLKYLLKYYDVCVSRPTEYGSEHITKQQKQIIEEYGDGEYSLNNVIEVELTDKIE